MNQEPLRNGGYLVRLESGSLAVEEVPNAVRGLVVQSGLSHLDGTDRVSGQYVLTRHVIKYSGLWHVRRIAAYRVSCANN